MAPRPERLVMYGQPSDLPAPEWAWVADRLATAGTYWVVPRGGSHPHPRPVWGVWHDETLLLSIGSPVVARLLAHEPAVTVHLGDGVDVVVVEGTVHGFSVDPQALRAYDRKYEWNYDVGELGPLTRVAPSTVLAWRSTGWAGREGFSEAGRWRFTDAGEPPDLSA